MSIIAVPSAADGPTIRRATCSEAIKLLSLRSLVWLGIFGTLVLLVVGPVQSLGSTLDMDTAGLPGNADAAVSLALSGVSTSMIIFGVLGVLSVTSEYKHRSIRITFTALPRRHHAVWGKAAAVGSMLLALLLPATVLTLEVSRRILASADVPFAWTDPGVARVVVASAWLMTGYAMLGQILGWIIRSAVGAAFALLGLMFVLPVLVRIVAGAHAAALLPSEMGLAMLRVETLSSGINPWVASLGWTSYLVAGLVFAVWLTRRRDH